MNTDFKPQKQDFFEQENQLRVRLASLIGKKGIALSNLSPIGYIIVEGKSEVAICESIPIPSGARVLITGVKMNELIVELAKDQRANF